MTENQLINASTEKNPGTGRNSDSLFGSLMLDQSALNAIIAPTDAPSSIVWDIGAGSGSVGLEAARLCARGHVYAIEKNADDVAIAGRNRAGFGLSNHTLVHGKAPSGLEAWADPDAVFIGGSGGELAELIALCLARLKPGGWLVMNFVTIENLSAAVEALKTANTHWDVLQLQASRSKPILQMHRLAAENPVWIVCAQAGGQP